VAQALDGAGLWQQLATRKPDLIVLDVLLPMPTVASFWLSSRRIPRLRASRCCCDGALSRLEREIALDMGAEDFFEKGPTDELEGKIERILLRISERIPVR